MTATSLPDTGRVVPGAQGAERVPATRLALWGIRREVHLAVPRLAGIREYRRRTPKALALHEENGRQGDHGDPAQALCQFLIDAGHCARLADQPQP